jgi:hypothetical protein
MGLFRPYLRPLAAWLILALLGMQQALGAYVCPLESPAAAVAVADRVDMANMPGCDGDMADDPDSDPSLLCRVHCEQGSQVVNLVPGSVGLFAPVLLAVLDWSASALALLPATGWSGRRVDVRSGVPPPGLPPLYLAHQALRN